MVESLKELNKLCQKPDYKTQGNWYVRTILRDAALPVTRILLHTPVTANQVTLISLAMALTGTFFLTIAGNGFFIAGAVLLQLWYYLDHVDGQIARYRKTASLTGRFLDFMTHHLVHAALLFSLGFYGYQATTNILFVISGFIASIAILIFNMTHDVKCKVFVEAILKMRQRDDCIFRKIQAPDADARGEIKKVSRARRLFSLSHKLCEIHVLVNILTTAAVIQLFAGLVDCRFVLCMIYSVIAPFNAVMKLGYILTVQKIDKEYDALFGCMPPARHNMPEGDK